MWIYEQETGRLLHGDELVGIGYSGKGLGKNNPVVQTEHNVGPIPTGLWEIGEPFDSEDHGPHAMHLTPLEGTTTYGRYGFLLHGDSITHPGEASEGCIIQSRTTRNTVSSSGDKLLKVI